MAAPLPPLSQQALDQALIQAVVSGDRLRAADLLQEGASPDARQVACGEPILSHVVCFEDAAMVRLFISHGVSVDATDKAGVTPLCNALEMGELENARLLISAGADVNFQKEKGKSPTALSAALTGDLQARSTRRTLFLLGYNPDVNAILMSHDGKEYGTADVLLARETRPGREEGLKELQALVEDVRKRLRAGEELRQRREDVRRKARKDDKKFKLG